MPLTKIGLAHNIRSGSQCAMDEQNDATSDDRTIYHHGDETNDDDDKPFKTSFQKGARRGRL